MTTILFEGKKSEKMKMYSVCRAVAREERSLKENKVKAKKTILRYILKARTQYLYYTRECIPITHAHTHGSQRCKLFYCVKSICVAPRIDELPPFLA